MTTKVDVNEWNFSSWGPLVVNVVLLVVLQVKALGEVNTMGLVFLEEFDRFVFSTLSYLTQAGVLTYLGIGISSSLLRYSGLALFCWSALWVFFLVMARGDLLGRVVWRLILGVGLILASFWYYGRGRKVSI